MSYPVPPSDQQGYPTPGGTGAAPAPWTPPGEGAPGGPPQKSGLKKVLGGVGAVVVAGAVGAGWWLTGPSTPEVGDCVRSAGDSFDVVDCSDADAEGNIVGVEAEKVTQEEFDADLSLCSRFPATTMVLWSGDEIGPDGLVLCAGPV